MHVQCIVRHSSAVTCRAKHCSVEPKFQPAEVLSGGW